MRILRANKNTKIYSSPFYTGIEHGVTKIGEGDCVELQQLSSNPGKICNGLLQVKLKDIGWRWVVEKDFTSFGKTDKIPERSIQTIDAEPNCPLSITNN